MGKIQINGDLMVCWEYWDDPVSFSKNIALPSGDLMDFMGICWESIEISVEYHGNIG